MTSRFSLCCLFAATLALAITPAGAATHHRQKTHRAPEADASPTPEVLVPANPANGIPQTHASSVMVIDANDSHVLYQKNADEERPPASTQKLLTALLIVEAGNLDKPVTVEYADTL